MGLFDFLSDGKTSGSERRLTLAPPVFGQTQSTIGERRDRMLLSPFHDMHGHAGQTAFHTHALRDMQGKVELVSDGVGPHGRNRLWFTGTCFKLREQGSNVGLTTAFTLTNGAKSKYFLSGVASNDRRMPMGRVSEYAPLGTGHWGQFFNLTYNPSSPTAPFSTPSAPGLLNGSLYGVRRDAPGSSFGAFVPELPMDVLRGPRGLARLVSRVGGWYAYETNGWVVGVELLPKPGLRSPSYPYGPKSISHSGQWRAHEEPGGTVDPLTDRKFDVSVMQDNPRSSKSGHAYRVGATLCGLAVHNAIGAHKKWADGVRVSYSHRLTALRNIWNPFEQRSNVYDITNQIDIGASLQHTFGAEQATGVEMTGAWQINRNVLAKARVSQDSVGSCVVLKNWWDPSTTMSMSADHHMSSGETKFGLTFSLNALSEPPRFTEKASNSYRQVIKTITRDS
jgi:hypothetical protein